MAGLWEIGSYIQHRISSKSWRSFHSPFLFSLFRYILDDRISIPTFEKVEEKRKDFLNSKQKIQVNDFGAGSKVNPLHISRAIGDIARSSLSLPLQCRIMSRLATAVLAKNIVELGTSLGLSAAYLASAQSDSTVFTIEGDTEVANIADQLFQELELKNVVLINSTFERLFSSGTLPFNSIDLVFIDGNHRKDALVDYYQQLAPYFHADTIAVIDDIYWSKDMQAGWRELINMQAVTQSVDCYQFGILIFKKDFLQKQHHKVRLPLKSLF
ncbi:MAG TPA: class I SAM-dependent methyltransferase [Saprospiraceae bacterium]|nr:class I SAM-dependent methyltransferase [Saprospiraceae bacterium]